MSRQIRIIQPREEEIGPADWLAEQHAWGEQPPSYVPGEILIADRSKAAEILREARRRGKVFVRRKSSIVAVSAAIVGVSSAIGASAWWTVQHDRKKKKSPTLRIGDLLGKKK